MMDGDERGMCFLFHVVIQVATPVLRSAVISTNGLTTERRDSLKHWLNDSLPLHDRPHDDFTFDDRSHDDFALDDRSFNDASNRSSRSVRNRSLNRNLNRSGVDRRSVKRISTTISAISAKSAINASTSKCT
jgi:hypothetical protein